VTVASWKEGADKRWGSAAELGLNAYPGKPPGPGVALTPAKMALYQAIYDRDFGGK
jgi:hypothetical protein